MELGKIVLRAEMYCIYRQCLFGYFCKITSCMNIQLTKNPAFSSIFKEVQILLFIE